MLSQNDIEWIKSNRSAITESRTESIVLLREVAGEPDPFTGEGTSTIVRETADVIWKEYSTVANGDRTVIGGVELLQDDVKVTFDASANLTGVYEVERQGEAFSLVAIDEKGIGGLNRYECVARRTT